jgi:hypothetical protein
VGEKKIAILKMLVIWKQGKIDVSCSHVQVFNIHISIGKGLHAEISITQELKLGSLVF